MTRAFLIFACGIVAYACEYSTDTGPAVESYALAFQTDSATVYACSSNCGACSPYCMQMVGNTTTFAGTLSIRTSEYIRLLLATETASAAWKDWANDSLAASLKPDPMFCNRYDLVLHRTGHNITGTFRKVTDCHGAHSRGTITGS